VSVSNGQGAVLALGELSLVSTSESGGPEPLPAGLGEMPLYLEDDDFHSVNGPLDLTTLPPYAAVAPVNHCNHSAFYPGISTTRGGQQTRSEKRGYLCSEPGCNWRSSFPTKQALDRHREVKHLGLHVDCPIPGCEKVGDKGIKRKDNLPVHVLKKHGINLTRRSRANRQRVLMLTRYHWC